LDQLELPGMPVAPLDVLHVQLSWSVLGRPSIRVCCRRHGQTNWGRAESLDMSPCVDDELLDVIDATVRTAIWRSLAVRDPRDRSVAG
jgi:hypothetical protein